MKKYSFLVCGWTITLVIVVLFSTANLTNADPTDDFSFTVGAFPKAEVFHFMTEEEVTEILKDRLDLFPKSQAPQLARHLLSLCKRFRLDPAFVLSLIQVESSFRVKAISPVGAVGLMQIMIPTAKAIIREQGIHFSGHESFKGYHLSKGKITREKLADPFVNTALGIAYLAWLRDYYEDYSPYHVVAAYNVGPARMDELLARKSFKPMETAKYYLSIRRGIPEIRFYKSSGKEVTRKKRRTLKVRNVRAQSL